MIRLIIEEKTKEKRSIVLDKTGIEDDGSGRVVMINNLNRKFFIRLGGTRIEGVIDKNFPLIMTEGKQTDILRAPNQSDTERGGENILSVKPTISPPLLDPRKKTIVELLKTNSTKTKDTGEVAKV